MELIQDCRASGLTVTDWCAQHSIPRKSYANAVSRLSREGLVASHHCQRTGTTRGCQEVVDVSDIACGAGGAPAWQPALSLKAGGYTLEISNSAAQDVILYTLAALRQTC